MALPFVVPGYEATVDRALRPWNPPAKAKETEHDQYYCQVGGLREACAKLAGTAVTPSVLSADSGCLLMVNGPALSGKSSLLHRCAKLARDSADEGHEVSILDLSGVTDAGWSLMDRAAKVAEQIKVNLLSHQLRERVHAYLERQDPNLDAILPVLGQIHAGTEKTWFVLLLPPLDVERLVAGSELRRYNRLLTGTRGVTCLVESAFDQPLAIDSQYRATTVRLRHLERGEPRKLVEAWPGREQFQPIISPPVLDEVEAAVRADNYPLTTGSLLRALRAVYRNRGDDKSAETRLESIEPNEIVDALLGPFKAPGDQEAVHP